MDDEFLHAIIGRAQKLNEELKPDLFARGDKVGKFRGQVRYVGTICTHYYTIETSKDREYLRYVVQIHPQGFQYIASPDQLTRIESFD